MHEEFGLVLLRRKWMSQGTSRVCHEHRILGLSLLRLQREEHSGHLGDRSEVQVLQKTLEVRTGEMKVNTGVDCRMEFCQQVAWVGEHAGVLGLGSPLAMAEISSRHKTCRQWGKNQYSFSSLENW